jgi:hypothetical protein
MAQEAAGAEVTRAAWSDRASVMVVIVLYMAGAAFLIALDGLNFSPCRGCARAGWFCREHSE